VTGLELSKRLAACPRFRWLPGMLLLPEGGDDVGRRVVSVQDDQRWLLLDNGDELPADLDGLAPDLADPATLGAVEFGLLAGLDGRLRYDEGGWCLLHELRRKVLIDRRSAILDWPNTRTHALVLALESYP
jgi:hypothetical protein